MLWLLQCVQWQPFFIAFWQYRMNSVGIVGLVKLNTSSLLGAVNSGYFSFASLQDEQLFVFMKALWILPSCLIEAHWQASSWIDVPPDATPWSRSYHYIATISPHPEVDHITISASIPHKHFRADPLRSGGLEWTPFLNFLTPKLSILELVKN